VVCRLCGSANAPQQTSCTACGWPLERAAEARGPLRPGEGRAVWPIWVSLCAALGAGLGLIVARVRAGGPLVPHDAALAIVIGAAAGATLGVLPGPGARGFQRGWAGALSSLYTLLASRALARARRACELALEENANDAHAQSRLAAVLWLDESRERAEQVLGRLMALPDPSPLVRHNYAVAQAAAGRQARAVEEFEQARRHLGTSRDPLWNLGLARWALGEFSEAARWFQEIADLHPSDRPARNALALAWARQGDTNRAITELEEVLRTGGREPDVLCNLGIIHQARGDLAVATRYFTGALHRDPAHVAARYNRGLCSMLQGRYHGAVEDLAAVGQLAPDHAWAHVERAVCWYRLGQTGRALEATRNAMRAGPGDFQVRYNGGTLFLREGIVEQALRELEKAYELEPRNVDVIVNLGVATYLAERLRQALDQFRAAVRLNPKHALARFNCAIAYCMLDMHDEAQEQLDELTALYPDFPEVFNAVGVVRLLQNRLVEAAEEFRRAADATPRAAVVRSNLSLTYYLEGDVAAAAEQARYAVSLDGQLPAARDLLGHAAVDLNEITQAIEEFRVLARLEPSNPDAHSNLGLAYYKDDRLNEAVEAYKRALIFSPRSPEGHNDLGLAYAKNKMLAEAARHLTQVIGWRPTNPIARSNLGLVYFFKGETENAVDQWREVTRLSPSYARLREATRFSAYDDQEMVMRPVDRKRRALQFPLKVAAFRHSFQLALDERDYRIELPWPELAAAQRWQQRARRARQVMLRP